MFRFSISPGVLLSEKKCIVDHGAKGVFRTGISNQGMVMDRDVGSNFWLGARN